MTILLVGSTGVLLSHLKNNAHSPAKSSFWGPSFSFSHSLTGGQRLLGGWYNGQIERVGRETLRSRKGQD